jgi:hypothetical protein
VKPVKTHSASRSRWGYHPATWSYEESAKGKWVVVKGYNDVKGGRRVPVLDDDGDLVNNYTLIHEDQVRVVGADEIERVEAEEAAETERRQAEHSEYVDREWAAYDAVKQYLDGRNRWYDGDLYDDRQRHWQVPEIKLSATELLAIIEKVSA